MGKEEPGSTTELERTRDLLAQRELELEGLRRQLSLDPLLHNLRAALTLAATTETVAAHSTHSQLLELIVHTAARVIRAHAASLLLVDRETQELMFAVTFPAGASDLQALRVPVGEGIAGLVAMTGQPMAVSNARSDPRHASRIAEQIGYLPDSLVCVPLLFTDEVVGVLELLDKQDAGFFDSADMETLGLFARLAAVAIEQSRTRSNLASMLFEVPALRATSGRATGLDQQVADFAASLEHEPRFRRSLELAQLVHQIAQAGDEEVEACAGILDRLATYIRARAEPWRVLSIPH